MDGELKPVNISKNVKVTNMGSELQSQNRVDVDYEKTTGPFLLQSTIKIQK